MGKTIEVFQLKWFDSIPFLIYSSVAQLVEQRTVNPFVAGSNPAWGAKIMGMLSANQSPWN